MIRFLLLSSIFLNLGLNAYSQNDGEKLNSDILKLDYHFDEFDVEFVKQKLAEYQKLSILEDDTLAFVRCVSLYSRLANEETHFGEALIQLEKAKFWVEESSDELVKATYYLRLGTIVFYHMEEVVTHQNAYEEGDVLNDSTLSYLDHVINDLVKSRDPFLYFKGCYVKSLSLRRLSNDEAALTMLDEAETIIRTNNFLKYRIPILNHRASILEGLERNDEANDLYLYAIQEAKAERNSQTLMDLYYNYGDFLYSNSRDAEAIRCFLRCDSLQDLLNSPSEARFRTVSYLHELYSYVNQSNAAYEWSQKALEHYKEIETAEMRLRFEQMQIETANFENERLAFEHAEKRFEAEKESQKQTKRAVLFGSAAIFLLILVAGVFYFNRLNAKNKTLVHEKEVSELIRQQEIASMESMIEGQETERIRLGRELHDHIGSLLSTLGMHFTSAFEKNFGISVQENKEASRVLELLDNTVQETRKLSHDLMTGVLNRFGLVSAIRDLCDQISETGKVNVLFNSIGMDERLDPLIELNVYRVAQELISNALKHASPENIRVNLVKKKDAVSLTVKDDGIGMSEAVFNQSKGAGSTNVKGRVASMQGKIEFDDQVERGTMIKIIIPIKA